MQRAYSGFERLLGIWFWCWLGEVFCSYVRIMGFVGRNKVGCRVGNRNLCIECDNLLAVRMVNRQVIPAGSVISLVGSIELV